MRKSSFTRLKSLLLIAIAAGVAVSCQEDKPDIIIPDPVTPEKEFKYFEAYTNDTLAVDEGKPASIRFKTIPWNLVKRDSTHLSIIDTAGVKYEYASISAPELQSDSSWVVTLNLLYGSKNDDAIRLMITDKDTTFFSDLMIVRIIPAIVPTKRSVSMVSKVSAFEGNDSATVRFKTKPWNLMDSIESLQITDTLGLPIEIFKMGSRRFVPADSSWAVKVKFKDSKMEEADAAVSLAIPGDTILSDKFTVKKVTFKMSGIRIYLSSSGTDIKASGNTYTHVIPTATDFSAYSKQKVQFRYEGGDRIVVNDTLDLGYVNQGQVSIDLSQPAKISLYCYDLHKDYIVKLVNTGLPIVRINTNGQSVSRRDTWVPGASMRIELPDGTVDYEGSLSLKGRGNGTWTETNKKPYALKLDEKAKILGMHKQKRWCLLANYKDRTLLRNDISFWVARQTEMPYTVSGRFVELVWNGKHMGNYYLCEQIRIDNHRVDIANPNLQDPEKGGMLILIDDFLDYSSSDRYDKSPMVGFRSTGASSRYKLPYVLKDPDEDENGNLLTSSSPTFKYLQNYVKNMEDAIYGLKNNSDNSKVKKYLDYDRAIDYVLIQELTMNHDSYNTWPQAGPKSAYMYKDSCGLLCYGPVWDFDYHTFTLYNDYSSSSWSSSENSRLRQWEILKMDNKGNNKYYFADLAKYDPEFRSLLVQRWNKYKNTWKTEFPKYVDMMADSIRLSESCNRQLWPQGGFVDVNSSFKNYHQNGDWDLTFQQAVDAVKTAFQKRWTWIDQNISKLGQ